MAKKKLSKKTKIKKPANKKPPVKAAVKKQDAKASAAKPAKPVKQAAEPALTAKDRPKRAAWLPVIAVAVLLALSVVYAVSRPADESNMGPNSGNTDTSLRVVPGQAAGTSSSQAAGALQPQAAGLQQTQSNTQSAGGTNLQPAPSQATTR